MHQGLILPVGRPKKIVVPKDIEKYFTEEDWEMVWWKKREKLWFFTENLYDLRLLALGH